ncbi:MAG: TetR/AcrR family transcriptional regulator [Spirochaetales bacterium]|nr:TetR/AcrR family transcriptional regulator [Spirochaetales bacterium]
MKDRGRASGVPAREGASEHQRAEETRERILGAAEECFARDGFEATGVAEICTVAGVSKGALYHHFPSKQTIFVELYERWMEGFMEEMRAVRDEAGSVPQALMVMVRMIGVIFQTASEKLPVFFEFLTKSTREPEIWKATAAPYRLFKEFFAEMIRRGIQEGSLKDVDPERTAQILVSYGAGLVMQGVFDPQGGDWVRVGVEGLGMLLEPIVTEGI